MVSILRAFVIFSLLLSIVFTPASCSSAWFGVWSQPMQGAMYQGVFSYYPHPMVAGTTESIGIEIRNVGSIVFRVTSVELKTDWAIAYYATDVPQVIDTGRSYKFAFSIPIPSSAVGSHTFETTFWAEVPTSSGSWGPELPQKLSPDLTVKIETGPLITGPTTIVMGTDVYTCDQVNCYIVRNGITAATFTGWATFGRPTQQPFDWAAFLLPIVAVLSFIIVVLLVIQLRTRRKA